MVQPDIVHVHNLLNLSFDLPAAARARGIPVVATLHDYTLVCPSGGQRVHRADAHVCTDIDTDRCARCFGESPFAAQASFGALAKATVAPLRVLRAAHAAVRSAPRLTGLAAALVRRAQRVPATREAIEARLAAARRVFDLVDAFVAPSASIAREFERLGIASTKLRVSGYGLEPLTTATLPESAPEGPLRIGYVGTLVWHKGVHVLLDALAGIPTRSYLLKIFGSPSTFPDYVSTLRAAAVGRPVHWMGPFDRHDAGRVYAQLDVLVVPSLWLENSPFVVREALAAGVPVVGADIGGIPELIRHDVDGLLYDSASAPALAAALNRLLDDRALLGRLREGARSRPRSKSIAEDAGEWEELYAAVIGRRRPELAAP